MRRWWSITNGSWLMPLCKPTLEPPRLRLLSVSTPHPSSERVSGGGEPPGDNMSRRRCGWTWTGGDALVRAPMSSSVQFSIPCRQVASTCTTRRDSMSVFFLFFFWNRCRLGSSPIHLGSATKPAVWMARVEPLPVTVMKNTASGSFDTLSRGS